MFDWTWDRPQSDEIPEPAMGRLGAQSLPRGRLISVSGPDPERRQQRLWCWAEHAHDQGLSVLWLDPLGLCLDRLGGKETAFPVLSPRSHEAMGSLLEWISSMGRPMMIFLDDYAALRPEALQEQGIGTAPPPWRDDVRHLARWTGLCWRCQCTLVVGRRGYDTGRDPVDDHAVLRFRISPTRGSLQLLESRALAPGPGWRRLPGD